LNIVQHKIGGQIVMTGITADGSPR